MKRLSIFLLFLLLSINIFAQPKKEVSIAYWAQLSYFEQTYPQAYDFAITEGRKLYKKLKSSGYKYALEAASTVFPELLRYKRFQDEIESLADEILVYTTDLSSSFSIGLFQMKPVFAAKIEKIVMDDKTLAKKYPKICFSGNVSTVQEKKDRILRLRSYDRQIDYLKAFTDYEVKNLNLQKESFEERLKYLSTAYNSGIQYSREQLDNYASKDLYPVLSERKYFFNYNNLCQLAAKQIKKIQF